MLKRQNVRGGNQVKVTFVIDDDPNKGRIFVVGDFNDWQESEHLMVRRNNDTRSASLVLDPGRYAFRYCTEDGEWFNDAHADAYEANDQGTENCILVV